MTNPNATGRHRGEANVELNLRLPGPSTVEEMRDRSTSILDALRQHASDSALAVQVLEDADREFLSFQFDVPGADNAEVLQRLSQIVAIVEREAGIAADPIGITATFTGTLSLDADEVPWLDN